MLNPQIKLVCFDIGGVLMRCVGGWAEACQRAGVPLIDDGLTAAQRRGMAEAARRFETGELTTAQFAEALRRCSGYSTRQVRAALDAWLIELYPGIEELLERVLATGVRTAVLSNTNPAHWRMMREDLDRFGALWRTHHHFASHLVGARKPDERVYGHVEREVGVEPGSILFFDDREENLAGAVFQLWNAEQIDPMRDPARQLARYLERYRVL